MFTDIFGSLAALTAAVLVVEELIDRVWDLDGIYSQIRTAVIGALSGTAGAFFGWGMFSDPATCGGQAWYVCGPVVGLLATAVGNALFSSGPLFPALLEKLKIRPPADKKTSNGGGSALPFWWGLILVSLASQGAKAQELSEAYWEVEPSLLTGFIKVVEKSGDDQGTLTGQIFASAGIGVMYSSLDATDPEDIVSDFGIGGHLMLGGDFDNFLVTVALPTLSFFDGFLMVSPTYDLGNVGDRSRFGAIIGTNFEGIIGEVF